MSDRIPPEPASESTYASLVVPHHVAFIPTICFFAQQIAATVGASPAEAQSIELAAEEVAMLVLEKFPAEDDSVLFEIACRLGPRAIAFTFSNKGTPMAPDRLPTYDQRDPLASDAGLGLHLIRTMVDRCDFVNRGHEGWQIVVEKRLAHAAPPRAQQKETPAEDAHDKRIEGGQKIHAVRATPEMAAQIMELTYRTYRYSYTLSTFYYEDRLREALAREDIVSIVAMTEGGTIVGHFAVIFPPHTRAMAEVGAAMIAPEYRNSPGLLRMIRKLQEEVDRRYLSGVLCFGKLITAHTLSQQLAGLFDLKPMGFRFSTHDRARFVNMDVSTQRETILYMVMNKSEAHRAKINIPARHAPISGELFGDLRIATDLISCEEGGYAPEGPQTRFADLSKPSELYGEYRIESIGDDFAQALRRKTFEVDQDRMETCLLQIPAWKALPPEFEQILCSHRFFFSGFMAEAYDKWYLLYTCLYRQRFDFSQILVHSPFAEKLLKYTETLYRELTD